MSVFLNIHGTNPASLPTDQSEGSVLTYTALKAQVTRATYNHYSLQVSKSKTEGKLLHK